MTFSVRNHIMYYERFKNLVSLHQQLRFGKNPPLPTVFTESVTRYLLGYSTSNTRCFDAMFNSKYIEIKATGTREGTTTINFKSIRENADNFSHLTWTYFDFYSDKIYFSNIEIAELITHPKYSENNRVSISLNNYRPVQKRVFMISISNNTITEIISDNQ
jgi:hypothetical protein